MALLDSIISEAIKTATDTDKQKAWIEKGFDATIEEARKILPGDELSEGEIKAARDTASFALDKVVKHKDALVGLGERGLQSTLALVGLGRYDNAAEHAKLITLRETASWGEVSAAVIAKAKDGNEAKRRLDADVKAFKDTLKDIGITAAKSLIPLLLAI